MTDYVKKITGNFGIWQLRAVLIIFLCKIPASWFMACIIFTAPALKHDEVYCIEANTNETRQIKQNFNLNNNQTDYCNLYVNYNEDNQSGIKTIIQFKKPCSNFIYRTSKFYSLIMQFNLICNREILIAWTQFWHLFGILIGGIVATKLMCFLSPRRVMLLGMLTQIISGCLTGLVNNLTLHCFFRCISAICCALMFTGGQNILIEITGGNYRIGVIILYDTFWSLGVILLPQISNLFTTWSYIYLGITFPTLLLIFLYKWIPDAPRWLLKQGHIQQAYDILCDSIRINERDILLQNNNIMINLQEQAKSLKKELPSNIWWGLWYKSKNKIHIIAVHIAWAIYVTNFNGMLLNIRSFGTDYLTINTTITGISEIIGCFIGLYFAIKTKNKWFWAGLYNILAGALGCLGWMFPFSDDSRIQTASWMLISSIPKVGVSISQSLLLAFTPELVSEENSQMLMFSCIIWARIWLLTAPFINILKNIDTALSLTTFSLLGIIGGIAMCCLSNKNEKRRKIFIIYTKKLSVTENVVENTNL